MQFTCNLSNISEVAEALVPFILQKKNVAFSGEMGAGKTTLISFICKALKVVDEPSSPTYSIINEYLTTDNKTVFHMDWFRLKTYDEALGTGIEDCLLSKNICLVKWPSIVPELITNDFLNINIEIKENNRIITIK